jgi:hypothetical protein
VSHTAKISSTMTDHAAMAEACIALGMVPPTHETVRFFDGRQVTGTAIRLPGWQYPVVISEDGELTFDDYNGHWGKPQHLEAFRMQYTLAIVRQSMGDSYMFETETLPSGDLRVVLTR